MKHLKKIQRIHYKKPEIENAKKIIIEELLENRMRKDNAYLNVK